MHMADALVSTPIALTAAGIAAVVIGVAGKEVKKNPRPDIIPLMGVMGAFIFAAQMINFTIPGTGSSGHIVGGVMLAALLGPWAGFLTLASVLIIQCLIFADGGLLALGCNIINMGVMTALVAYPLIYRPLVVNSKKGWRIMIGAILACVIGLEFGACLVTVETELSGITALPTGVFLGFMTGIHCVIGLCEGVATGLVLLYVSKVRPSLLSPNNPSDYAAVNTHNSNDLAAKSDNKGLKTILWSFGIGALILGGCISFYASSNPDGLEWSIEKITGSTELEAVGSNVATAAEKVINTTAIMPDYENNLSGVVGALLVLLLVWAISSILIHRRKA